MTYNIKGFGPDDLLTGTKEGFRRLRVDQAKKGGDDNAGSPD